MVWFGIQRRPVSKLEELAQAVVAGRESAVRPFLSAVAPETLRIVRQVLGRDHPEVEDVVQDALVATLEALPRFRGECTVRHFARRVALLTVLNTRRRLQLRQRIAPLEDGADTEALPGRGPSPAEDLEAEARRCRFLALLDELPAPQAEVIAMHCILGYTVAETAEASGVPINTVRGRLVSAKAALRQGLERDHALRELVRGAS